MAGIKAHQRYRNKAGTIVPGTTTITGQMDKPALPAWANNLGLQGINYKAALNQAGNVGTITHALVESFFKKETPDFGDFTSNDIKQARLAFSNFEDFWNNLDMEVLASEVQLVSEQYQYGGALDVVARSKKTDEIHLFDCKTSKAIYPEMRYQQAAYKYMWDENKPKQLIDSASIIRMDKFNGTCSLHNLGDLTTDFQIFLHLRDIYELKKRNDKKRRQDRSYQVPWWY